MKIEEKIRLVVERMDKLTYRFCDLKEINLHLDYDALPAFVNVMPLNGSIRITPTMVKQSTNCYFWIVDKVAMDADGEGIKEVTERCMDYAYEFLLWLNASKMFEPIENSDVNFTVVTDDFDANVSGVVLEMQLKEKEGLRLCLDKNPNEYFHEQRRCEEGGSNGIGEPSEENN